MVAEWNALLFLVLICGCFFLGNLGGGYRR